MEQKPSIGRIVHFKGSAGDPGPYAGIIVGVHEPHPGEKETVDLVTFGPSSIYHNHAIPFSAESKAGHWSWPPRT